MSCDYGDVVGRWLGIGDGRVVLYGEFKNSFLGVFSSRVRIFTDMLGGEDMGGAVEEVGRHGSLCEKFKDRKKRAKEGKFETFLGDAESEMRRESRGLRIYPNPFQMETNRCQR